MTKRKLTFRAKIIAGTTTVLILLSIFTIFEVDVDGSLFGALWQIVYGDQVVCGGLKITLPRHWMAVSSKNSTLLVHLAGKNTAEIFFVPTNSDSGKWEQGRFRWLESKRAKYAAEGYEQLPTPNITTLGEPATCLEVALKGNTAQVRLDCGIADGRMLVTFKGIDKDIPTLNFILASLRPVA